MCHGVCRRAVAALDFGKLSRQHKAAAAAAADRKRLDEEFRKDIEERSAVITRGAPNLKAVEQYQEAKVRLFFNPGSLAYVQGSCNVHG